MHLLILGHYPVRKYNGRYYIKRMKGKAFLNTHFAAFDTLTVCFRVRKVTKEPEDWDLIDDPRIDFVDFPAIRGWRSYLGLLGKDVKKMVFDAVDRADCVSTWGFSLDPQIGRYCNRVHKPFMMELVADSADTIKDYSNKFKWFYRLLAVHVLHRLRSIVRLTDVTIYVDKLTLPKRYPVSPGKRGVSCSDVGLRDELLTPPRVYTEPVQPLKIAVLSTMQPWKRHVDMIDACVNLKNEGKKVELHLLGVGPEKDNLVAYAKQKGLVFDKEIFFYGFVADPKRLLELVDACHIGALCSTTEGLSRALVEEMARGLGVVATPVGGNPELVREQELYPIGDVKTLTDILRDIIDDPKRLTAMSKHAVERAAEYSNSKLLKLREETYRYLASLAKK